MFAAVLSAYHELLAAKILNDLEARRSVIEGNAEAVKKQVMDAETVKKFSQGDL